MKPSLSSKPETELDTALINLNQLLRDKTISNKFRMQLFDAITDLRKALKNEQ